MQYEKDGNIFTFDLCIDKVIAKEREDPEYSLMSDLMSLDPEKFRFEDMERYAEYLGTTLDEMKAKGLYIADLFKILPGIIEDLGFTSEA